MRSGDIAKYSSSFPRLLSASGESSIFICPGTIVLLVKKSYDDWYVLCDGNFGLINKQYLSLIRTESYLDQVDY
jgi:hypothetical protein